MTGEEKKRRRNTILQVLFLAAMIVLTFWALFRDQDMLKIFRELGEVNPLFLVIGAAMVIAFVLCESLVLKLLFRTANVNASMRHCARYSFIGFFYSMITPSATGGQPMQVFHMRRHGIRVGTASVVLMIVTIEYKSVLILTALIILLFFRPLYLSFDPAVRVLFVLGLVLNTVFVAALAVLVFMPKLAHRLVRKIFTMLSKIRFLHLTEARLNRVENSMNVYQEASGLIRSNLPTVIVTQALTFVQRFILFSLTWLVYLSLDLHGAHFVSVAARQAVVSISSDMLPTPGGLGFAEFTYMRVFQPVFGDELMTTVSLMMSRGFSYYFLVIASGIVTFAAHITMTVKGHRRRKRSREVQKEQKE